MASQVAAEGLEGLVAVAALVFFLSGPLRWYAIDWARERMFAARDQLFDEAAQGRISFDDPCYNAVRRRINENIRFAHSGSLLQVLAHLKAGSVDFAAQSPVNLRETVDRITDTDARAVAHRALDRVEMTSVALLAIKSPFSTVAIVLWLAPRLLAARKAARRSADRWAWLRPYAGQIQAEVPALARVRR